MDEIQSLKANLEETLREIRRQFFGISSEKISSVRKEPASSTEGETHQEEPKQIEVKSHTRIRKLKSRREEFYANFPVKEVITPFAEEQKFCEYCNAEMTVIGHKTFMGTPYYRQEAAMFQLELKLPRKTMASWYISCAEDYFYPI